MLVNVEGTRRLMRYLIDRGCRKFVMASSIAAVGFQSRRFRPLQLPIPDTHPCLDRDGYGLSKYLMEEVTAYYQRQVEEIDVINLRLSSVCLDKRMPQRMKAGPLGEWALGGLTVMARSDAVRAFSAAAEALPRTGVRTMNAAGPKAWAAAPVAECLRGGWGRFGNHQHGRGRRPTSRRPGHPGLRRRRLPGGCWRGHRRVPALRVPEPHAGRRGPGGRTAPRGRKRGDGLRDHHPGTRPLHPLLRRGWSPGRWNGGPAARRVVRKTATARPKGRADRRSDARDQATISKSRCNTTVMTRPYTMVSWCLSSTFLLMALS